MEKLGGRIMDILHGACACTEQWRKPLQRIIKHHTIHGPEICPDCKNEIHWFKQTKLIIEEE